jgi:DNA segregation ATPase FtsK/SpoIIIE-like protein
MLSYLRKSRIAARFILMIFAFSLVGVTPASVPAQEQYPAVARLSFVSGPVTYSRGDDPDEWDDAIENVPLTIGDRIYAPEGGRAELQISSGNFVRLAPRSYLSTLNLSDDVKQFYLGEGAASFHIKRLQSDEVIEIDTPNVSVTLEEPGQYRVAVDDDGNSRVTVRRGRVTVAASGRQIAVENGEMRVYGIDSPRYEIVGLPAIDAFDRWNSERDDRFERSYSDASRYASEDIIGAEDLAEYGRWEDIPEYGYAWTPSRVATGWAPFSNGRWYWQDPWGWSWISNERWGWATSHYGRWTHHRSRWYWVPVRPRTRVRYAPACVEFVRVRDHVGWFPLHPRDRHVPWWERRDRRFDRNVTYVNRTYVTVVNHNTFITARPVNKYIVRDSVILRDARSARFTESLPIPNRSSLRIVSDNGARRGHRPSDKIVNRVAVVRTAVPASPRRFQDKLPEIQKNQGKAVEPARILAAARDERATNRERVRPAAESGRGDFAPRNPGATAGAALQPVTEARGKKLATRAESAATNAERPERAGKTPVQPEPGKATAGRAESPRVEQDRERQRQEKPTPARERQAQQQQEIERKSQAQKQQQERQAQEQKQREPERRQAPPQKQQPAQERPTSQQRLEELERRQAQQREEQRKAQLQNRQEQERREGLGQQQERQAQQQRQQEQEQHQRQEQQEQARKAQAQQQQEQARREQQVRQQQAQERQARDQQQRVEVERRQQQQQQREQARSLQAQRQEQAREQQQQTQQRQAQEAQRQQQQQQERRPQPRPRQPQQERPGPQVPAPQPGSF